MSTFTTRWIALFFAAACSAAAPTLAQAPSATAQPANGAPPVVAPRASAAAAVSVPAGYVIGPDDLLAVMYWREKDLSADVAVRPDGKISLPLINDITAAGLTPEQLRVAVTEAASKFVEEPTVSVVVKTINSRKVFITGQVQKPGVYPLNAPTSVVQLIAMAGGVMEFADKEKIIVLRTEDGRQVAHPFNYKHVLSRRNLRQNIELRPGDTVVVP